MVELECDVCHAKAKGSSWNLTEKGWNWSDISGKRGDGVKLKFRVARCPKHFDGMTDKIQEIWFNGFNK